MTNPASTAGAKPARFKLTLATLLMANGLAALDGNIVNTALPVIASEFHGVDQLSWIVTSFMLAQCSTMPLYGKLSDMYGRRPLFIWALAIFLTGSVLCGFAQSIGQMAVFRAIQGAGAAGIMVMSSASIADLVSPRERGRYQGLFMSVFAISNLMGPLIGGMITQSVGWRWVFLINLPLGALVLAMVIANLPRAAKRTTYDIDYLGALLIVSTAISLLLTLSWGGAVHPWTSPTVLSLVGLVVVLGGLLFWRERVAREPILPPRLFVNRTLSTCLLTTSLLGFNFFGAITFMPLYLQLARGFAPAQSGLAMTPQIIGLILASTVGGFIVARTGRYKLFIVCGAACVSSGLFLIGLSTRFDANFWLLEASLLLLGLGGGMCMPNLTVAVQNSAAQADIGSATSTLSFTHVLASASGVASAGAIMSGRLHDYLQRELPMLDADRLLSGGLEALPSLTPAQVETVQAAFAYAISSAFLVSGAIAIFAAVTASTLPKVTLRGA